MVKKRCLKIHILKMRARSETARLGTVMGVNGCQKESALVQAPLDINQIKRS